MIENTGWNYLYKLTQKDTELKYSSTNVLYTPTVNDDKDTMCMHFTVDTAYLTGSCVPRTEEMISYWFDRELKYLKLFQGKSWCPEIYFVNYDDRKIFIEFNKETLNIPVFTESRSLCNDYPNWKTDLYNTIE